MEAEKVIGGVLAGVGAVALLPVAGPIGAVSLLGALVGGTAGGIAGAVASEIDWDTNESAGDAADREETPEEQKKSNPWQLALEDAKEGLENAAFGDLVLALHAMGCAAWRADGIVIGGADWVRELRSAIDGLNLPEGLGEKIDARSGEAVTLATVAKKAMVLTFEARSRLSALLDGAIQDQDEDLSEFFPFIRSSLFGKVDSNEVLELVKSLLSEEPAAESGE